MWRSLAIDASAVCASFCAASFVGRALRVLQGTDLTGFAGHNLVARQSLNLAVCPSAACSPPLFANVPHAIASSRAVLRRPRFTGVSRQAIAQTITAYCLSKVTLNIQATAQCSAANPRGGYVFRNQIHGKGKRAQTLFHFAPPPNLAVKWDADTFQRFAIALWAPLTSALGFWVPEVSNVAKSCH